MFHSKKLKALAVAAAACAAMSVSMSANAYVYAMSHLELKDLVISFGGVDLTKPNNGVTIDSYQYTLTNNAKLGNTLLQSSSVTCGPAIPGSPCATDAPVLDATVVNGIGSAPLRAENNFSIIGYGGATSYSNADSVITADQITQGTPTATNQIAESLLTVNGSASASAQIDSTSTISLVFTLSGGAGSNMSLSFMADPDQDIQILDQPGTFNAQSSLQGSVSLANNAGVTQSVWNPNGDGSAPLADRIGCTSVMAGTTCVEGADAATLNLTYARGVTPISVPVDLDGNVFGAYQVTFGNLVDGTYTLALKTTTSTQISRTVQAVPEPGSLALIGVALAGLGFTARRRRA